MATAPVNLKVLVHPVLLLWTFLVTPSSLCYGFAPVKNTPLSTSATPFDALFRKIDQNTAASERKMGQNVHRMSTKFGKLTFQSTVLASSSSLSTEGSDLLSTDALWSRMEKVAKTIQASSKTGGYFTTKQVYQKDAEISNLLEAKAGISFQSPTTFAGVVKEYNTRGGGGIVTACILLTFLYRYSSIPLHPLGAQDILAFAGTRVFWEAQEWYIHFRWFHGGDNCRAHPIFKTHDRHHDLPYHHVAVEPLRLVVSWTICVIALLASSVHFLGLSPAVAAMMLLSYSTSAFAYSFLHCMCHSKIKFKGRMKEIKEYHIKHHMSPAHHLNMGPNNIDKVMKTDSYDTRLLRRSRGK